MAKAKRATIASNGGSAGSYRERLDATDLERIDVAFMDFIRVRYRYQEGESWHRDAVPIIQRARADSLKEAQIIIESWRRHYYAVRPHGSLGYRPPAPEVFVPGLARAWPSAQLAPTATLSLASNMPLN